MRRVAWALVLVACRSPQSVAIEPAEAAVAIQAPVQLAELNQVSPPEPAIEQATEPTPEQAVEPPRLGVLFRVEPGGLLVPLACYDTKAQALASGPACLPLVPPGVKVKLSTGETIAIRGPQRVDCDPSGEHAQGLALASKPLLRGGEDADFAWWPATTRDVTRLAAVALKPVDIEERVPALEAAVRKAAGPVRGKLHVEQDTATDIDGDGRLDRLWAVTIRRGNTGEVAFGGLFLANADAPERVTLVAHSDAERFRVLGVANLDGDARKELILHHSYSEGDTTSVMQWREGVLEEIGSWGCGA